MNSPSIDVRSVVLTAATAVIFSGCGLIQGMQEPPEEEEPSENQPSNGEEENACGGDEELMFEGEVADRGDRCGPCDRDTLQCDESDEEGNTLVCEPGGTLCRGPENVQATTDRVDDVIVSWEHVDGADEYVIYRDGEKLDTVSANDISAGSPLEFIDDEPLSATPLAPQNFEASDGGVIDAIELSWEFDPDTMLPDGEEHLYEVVAVHSQFEDGESNPEEATGHTVDEFDDDYQFRREGGDWISFSNPQCVETECQYIDELGDDGQGPNLSDVDAGSVDASEGAARYEITIEMVDAQGLATPTEYELRAVTEAGTEGDTESTTGHLGVEELTVQFQRADEKDADDEDFVDVGDTKSVDVVDDEDGAYPVVEPLMVTDLPPDDEAYYYRVAVWPHDHHEKVQFSDSDRGQRGEPRLYSTSDDDTLRAVDPTGEEVWEQGGFVHGVVFLATDPAGNVYATSDEPKSSVVKYDFEGDEQWEFDEPQEPVNYVATSPQDVVYATSGSRVYRIDEDDDTEFDYWEDADGRELKGVVTDADGYVYLALHNEDEGEYAIYRVDFSDDFGGTVSVEWSLDTDQQPTMVISGGDGYVYWGTMQSTVHRVPVDTDEPKEEKETINLPNVINVMGITITPDGRLYVGGYDTFGGPTGHVKGVDFDAGGSYQAVPHSQLDNLAVNQVAVDPEGHLYYATTSEYGDTDRHERVFKLDEAYEEVWVFEGHVSADGIYTDVRDIIVTPGFYGTFSETWEEIQDKLD